MVFKNLRNIIISIILLLTLIGIIMVSKNQNTTETYDVVLLAKHTPIGHKHPTLTTTSTVTQTKTNTPTLTATNTITSTLPFTSTSTHTLTPTQVITLTNTLTKTVTVTQSTTPVQTPTPSNTPTSTATSTTNKCDFTVSNDTELKTANSQVHAGQTICLNAGQYNTGNSYNIVPSQSGMPLAYITYTTTGSQGSVIFNGRNDVSGKSYLRYINIDFHAFNNSAWGASSTTSNHIEYDHCIFSGGVGWYVIQGNYFTFHNSIFNGLGTDMFEVQGSYSLFENNDFSQAGASHSLLALDGNASHIIVRENYFRNPYDRAFLAVKLEGTTAEQVLIENNIFIDTMWNRTDPTAFPNDPEDGGAEAIRINMPRVIFRNNLILGTNIGSNGEYNTALQGIVFNSGGNKLWFQDERIYNNTFYANANNAFALRRYSGVPCTYCSNNIFKNNIITQSGSEEFYQEDTGFTYLWDTNIFSNSKTVYVIKVNGNTPTLMTVRDAEKYLPAYFVNNFPQIPSFSNSSLLISEKQNPKNYGVSSLNNFMCAFSLTTGSAGKNSAKPLTFVMKSSTSSTTISVDDAFYFQNGMGIENGDKIIIGSNLPVSVTNIIDSHTITVDRPINVLANDLINLVSSTSDLGVYGCSTQTTIVHSQ